MSRWPRISSGFVKAMLAGHSALGLAFAALLYLVCISGTIVVFKSEIRQWEQPGAPRVEGEVSDAALANAMREIDRYSQAHGPIHSLSVWAPELGGPWLRARFYADDGGYEQWFADPATGELVLREHAPLAGFLVHLHDDLHLPGPWGRWLVGLMGVAMLSLVISGLLSHPRIFRDAFSLRWGGSKRLQEADLHNRLSVWALPFHLVISFTGAFLGLSFLIVAILAFAAYDGDQAAAIEAVLGPQAGEGTPAADLPDMEAIIADARARGDGQKVRFVSLEHPGEEGQLVGVQIETPDDLVAAEEYFYDGSGIFLRTLGNAKGPAGQQTLSAMGPLHFGVFGGMPVKILYGFLGLASTVVAVGGVTIWLARRADKGRPAPRWARVWTATVWGTGLGFAAAALGSVMLEVAPALVFAAALAGAFVLAIAFDAFALSRVLRGLTAAILVAAAGAKLAVHPVLPATAWGVTIALVAAALVLALSIRPVRRLVSLRSSVPAG